MAGGGGARNVRKPLLPELVALGSTSLARSENAPPEGIFLITDTDALNINFSLI